MKCHTNVNFTPPTQLPHKFSSIVAILIHNHFESPHIFKIAAYYSVIKNESVGNETIEKYWCFSVS
jgi:hypothetical protein